MFPTIVPHTGDGLSARPEREGRCLLRQEAFAGSVPARECDKLRTLSVMPARPTRDYARSIIQTSMAGAHCESERPAERKGVPSSMSELAVLLSGKKA